MNRDVVISGFAGVLAGLGMALAAHAVTAKADQDAKDLVELAQSQTPVGLTPETPSSSELKWMKAQDDWSLICVANPETNDHFEEVANAYLQKNGLEQSIYWVRLCGAYMLGRAHSDNPDLLNQAVGIGIERRKQVAEAKKVAARQ